MVPVCVCYLFLSRPAIVLVLCVLGPIKRSTVIGMVILPVFLLCERELFPFSCACFVSAVCVACLYVVFF